MINAQKQRKKPRGKSFEKGNKYAFQPGTSGNPGGLPRGTARLSTAYRKLLDTEWGTEPRIETIADQIALGVIEKAMNGDVRAASEIADRTEGRAIPMHSADADNGPVKVEVVWVTKGLAGEGEDATSS